MNWLSRKTVSRAVWAPFLNYWVDKMNKSHERWYQTSMDKELWVTFDDCDEKHFIDGNPHTFVGRVRAYCPKKDTYFNFSLSEVKEMSPQAKYWLKGYLSGSEPAPPVDEEGDPYPPDHEEELHWAKSVELFHQTGNWYHGEQYCDGCGERLLYSYIGFTCAKCSIQNKTDDSSS